LNAYCYGGVLREVAVHHAYPLVFLAGRPIRVSAHKTRVYYKSLEADQQVMLACEMPIGTLANLWGRFASSDKTSDPRAVPYEVFGKKGGARFT
jgi:predicted dehydrogenase